MQLSIPHLDHHAIHVALYRNVKNSTFVRDQLIQGNTAFEYAFLDAPSILSLNHLKAAIFRAINDSINNRLKSRNVHSEIVFSLSPTNNITDAFRKFGINNETSSLIAVKVIPVTSDLDNQLQQIDSHLKLNIEGDEILPSDANISELSDVSKIRQLYKATATSKAKQKDTIMQPTSPVDLLNLERIIIGSMAIKGS